MTAGSSNETLKMWVIASGIVAVVAVVLLFLHVLIPGTIEYDRSDLALYCVHDDQCERPGSKKLLAEFQNTLSNLAYLLFGICVIVRAWRGGVPGQMRGGALTFGVALCFLAVCSGYYHATLNFKSTHTGTHANPVLRAAPEPEHKRVYCAPADPEKTSEVPQLLDIVGVYAALIALFVCGIEGVVTNGSQGWASGSKVWAVIFGVGLPVVVLIGFPFIAGEHAAGAQGAGLVLALMLLVAGAFGVARLAMENAQPPSGALVWVTLVTALLVLALIAYVIKPELRWDSTGVFGAMIVLLLAVLGVNWSLSAGKMPWPEMLIVLIVFLLGIVPRLLDGYETSSLATVVVRRELCSPDGWPQAHAMWHVASALALVLTFDMIEKSKPPGDGSRTTVILPQGRWLSDTLESKTLQQVPLAIVAKVLLSIASVLLLIIVAVELEGGWAALMLVVVACALCALLWLWPMLRWRSR